MVKNKEYEVGYKKPPKHSQFKKGQSGNPKGRPKEAKNIRTVVNDVLKRKVTIVMNGKPRQVKFIEAFVNQMAAKALNGSTRDQIALFKLINDYAPELLSEPRGSDTITVQFVSPEGKIVDKYERDDQGNKKQIIERDPDFWGRNRDNPSI